MEKKRAITEKVQSEKNASEKTGRKIKSPQKQTSKTVENELKASQSSSPRKNSGLTPGRITRRSARLNASDIFQEQEDSVDKKKEESDTKSPSKRKGKLMKVSEEVESSDSPRSKRTKPLSSGNVEKEDTEEKSAEKKTRKQKRQSIIKEDDTQDQCSENIEESADVTDIGKKKSGCSSKKEKAAENECDRAGVENSVSSDSVSPKDNMAKKRNRIIKEDDTQDQCSEDIEESADVTDIGKKKSRRSSKKEKAAENECDKAGVENSVSSDSVSPKDNMTKKRNRKSKAKENELLEKSTQEECEPSLVGADLPVTSPKAQTSKEERKAIEKTDGNSPDANNKSSERTENTKESSSSLKSSTEDRNITLPTAEEMLIEKDESDNEVTFLSTKSRRQSKDPEVVHNEVKMDDGGESNDDIEITHFKPSSVKSSANTPIKPVEGKKFVCSEVILDESSSESDITFLATKRLTPRKPEVDETEIKEEEEVDISDSEVKCLTDVSKSKGQGMKGTNSMDVAMEVEIKDEEESNSEITCLSHNLKRSKKSKEEHADDTRESKNEDMLDVSAGSKKSTRKGKANRELQPSEIKARESFSKSQNDNIEKHSVQSYTKSPRFSKEGTSSKNSNIDPAQEYNRSISEEISLLKPKTFAARRSDSIFRKGLDDQCDGSGAEEDSDAECRKAIMESAQRRIEQSLSTSESDSRLIRGLHPAKPRTSKDEDISSDSGSAPEAVSFVTARKQTADSIKNVNEHIKRERQRLKEKRKARLELLKQQKEQKLIRLKEKMASQEDASCSSSEESGYEEELRNARLKMKKKKKVKAAEEPKEKENLVEPVPGTASRPEAEPASCDTSEQEFIGSKEAMSLNSLKRMQADLHKTSEEPVPSKIAKVSLNNGSIQEEKTIKKKKLKDDKKPGFNSLTNLDYIPLNVEGSTNFMVVPLEKTTRLSLAEEAKKFREENIYRWGKRESAAESLVARRKKRTAMKNAVKNRFK